MRTLRSLLIGLLLAFTPALACAANYSFSGTVGGANYPTCSGGSWSSGGTTYTCSGSITLNSGDTMTPVSSITVAANAGMTLNGNNAIGTATYTVNLQTTYGNLTINATSTVYGNLTASSGTITVSGTTVNGSISSSANISLTNTTVTGTLTTTGSLTISGGGVNGNVSANNGVTATNGAVFGGNVTSTNSSVSFSGGSVAGNVSGSNGVTSTNGTVFGGDVTAAHGSISLSGGSVSGNINSSGGSGITLTNVNVTGNANVTGTNVAVNITGGTISGNISSNGGGGITITNATMTSGSISATNVAINISGSTIGSSSSPVDITGNNTVTISNGSTVYGDVTSGNWSGALTVSNNSTVTGNCTPTNASCSSASPNLSVIKTVQVISDPVSGATLPKAIPSAVMQYTIQVTNSGPGTVDNNTVVISDTTLPSQVELCVSTLCAPSGPFVFTDSTPTSGLTCAFVALNSATDCVYFTNDGTTWTYTPTADANGYDVNVKGVRFRPTGTMNAAGASATSAQFVFRVKIK